MSANNVDPEQNKSIHKVELAEQQGPEAKGEALVNRDMRLIKDVKIRLSASVGSCELTVAELFDLKENSVVHLNSSVDDLIDVILDGNVIARGELVAVDDNFGVRIVEIAEGDG